ncbi:ribosome recycling factor [Xylona heveae TC161]|uniref:Ribosome recycling factor n=1 Tax=Xylona heveae (strain CBS 132557 / TC161) TaxID=1328760 RepID=A0A165JEG1_XYLHT|nr:ribosome recycling factor [Xylona heveae TC161]KZF26132.1 ribosome recycling factor [Xylona heveae TC161]
MLATKTVQTGLRRGTSSKLAASLCSAPPRCPNAARPQCHISIRSRPGLQHQILSRPLSTTCPLYKKKDKAAASGKGGKSSKGGNDHGSEASADAGSGAAADPHDMSSLEEALGKALERLKSDLSKLRTGGRFDPAVIEALPVHVDKKSGETHRLGDLAQVVGRPRALGVQIWEKDHIKAVVSAIQSSKYSLNPVVDKDNSSKYTVPIPPLTKETRMEILKTAQAASEHTNTAVKNARQAQQKKLRALQKTARPDDLRKAGDKMEKVAANATAEVKKIFEAAKKVITEQ